MAVLTPALIQALHQAGVECALPAGATLSDGTSFEPPCGLKLMDTSHDCSLGAFSYAVSGFYAAAQIGRYCSIGENVQVGRGAHPIRWMSTSPFFYAYGSTMFGVGDGFPDAQAYHAYRPDPPGPIEHRTRTTVPDFLEPTFIGHDVWIGHGAFVAQGVRVGTGAVVAGHSVVTKDVPPYAVVAGNPAEIKSFRFGPKQVAALLDLEWWNYAPWQLKGVSFENIDRAIEQLKALLPTLTPYAAKPVSVRELLAALP